MTSKIQLSIVALAAATLAACGGSGSSSSGGGGTSTFSGVTLSGTAATGIAMSGAKVEAKCATGTASVDAGADGAYTLKIDKGSLPCMIRAAGKDGTILHSVAEGSGEGTKTANISPLTEMVVVKVLGTAKTPTEVFGSFSATSKPDLSGLPEAKRAVAEVLKKAVPDADFTAVDPMTTTFTAATTAAPTGGDVIDKKLDKLLAAIKAGNPEATNLNEQIASVSAAIVAAPADNAAAVIGAALTKPPVDACPAARNVPYRIVGMGGSYGLAPAPDYGAKTITVKWGDGSSETNSVEFNSTQACRVAIKSAAGHVLDGAFAPSGVLVVRDPGSADSSAGLAIGFPEQSIPLADLAGKWNAIDFSAGGQQWRNSQMILNISATGAATVADCQGATKSTDACVDVKNGNGALEVLTTSINKDGGFDVKEADGVTHRAFAFRAPSGATFMVVAFKYGGIAIASKQRTLSLPEVGSVSEFWSAQAFVSSSAAMGSSFDHAKVKIQSVDATLNTATRVRETVNGKVDGRVDAQNFNAPRDGLRYRPAGSYTPTGSTTMKYFTESISMPLKDMGITVTIGSTAEGAKLPFLDLSVASSK